MKQNIKKLDDFYMNICKDIDEWLYNHLLCEYNNLFITENKHPIISLHSTTEESLISILNEGFNIKNPKAEVIGRTHDWPEAMFASPYIRGDKLIGLRSHNHYISFTNGFLRNIRGKIFTFFDRYGVNMKKFKEMNESKINFQFPIIIAAFVDEEKIKMGTWIQCYEPNKQVIILGVIYVKFSEDEIIDLYYEYKSGNYDNIFTFKKDINYDIIWEEKYIEREYSMVKFK